VTPPTDVPPRSQFTRFVLQECLAWTRPGRSAAALAAFSVATYFFEPYMAPLFGAACLLAGPAFGEAAGRYDPFFPSFRFRRSSFRLFTLQDDAGRRRRGDALGRRDRRGAASLLSFVRGARGTAAGGRPGDLAAPQTAPRIGLSPGAPPPFFCRIFYLKVLFRTASVAWPRLSSASAPSRRFACRASRGSSSASCWPAPSSSTSSPCAGSSSDGGSTSLPKSCAVPVARRPPRCSTF